jgi:bacterioferritin-associated ferredoxin
MDDAEAVAEEDVVCLCEWISREEIIQTIPHVRDLKELKEATGVCQICFGCEGDLDDIVAQHGHLFGTGGAA